MRKGLQVGLLLATLGLLFGCNWQGTQSSIAGTIWWRWGLVSLPKELLPTTCV